MTITTSSTYKMFAPQRLSLLSLLLSLALTNFIAILPAANAEQDTTDLQVVYAVNAGGYDHMDVNGIQYEADPLTIGTASDYGNHLLMIRRVASQDEVLYRTERYHTATFGYNLPLDGDGTYALVLKFCEVYFNEPNMKKFNVVLNHHHIVVPDLDIFARVGRGTAHDEYVYFTVSRGQLHYQGDTSELHDNFVSLEFIKGAHDNPKINAFVLFKGDVTHIPKLKPLPMEQLHNDDGFEDNRILESNSHSHKNKYQAKDNSMEYDDDDGEELNAKTHNQQHYKADAIIDDNEEPDDLDYLLPSNRKPAKTSGPRQPNPYATEESMILMPVFVVIACFIPLLFCLCKL